MADNNGQELKGLAKWTQILLTPVVVAGVGIVGTYSITTYQIKSADTIAKANLESAERKARADYQLKILEIFNQRITSKEPREREIAVRLLSSLEPDLGHKIAEAVADNPLESDDVRSAARTVAESSGYSFPLIGSYRRLEEASLFADSLAEKFEWPPEVYLSPSGFYAVTLGGYLNSHEALKRVGLAKSKGYKDALVRTTREWGRNLL